MKTISEFFSENFEFLEIKFSIYLNRRVFVMIMSSQRKSPFHPPHPHPHFAVEGSDRAKQHALYQAFACSLMYFTLSNNCLFKQRP